MPIAASAARSGSDFTIRYSPIVWYFPPTGPSPSSVGMPIAAVQLPSLPPPVGPAIIVMPASAAVAIQRSASAAIFASPSGNPAFLQA